MLLHSLHRRLFQVVRVRHRLRPPLSLTLASCLIALVPSRKHALLFWLASLPVPARRNHGPRIRPPPAYAYRPPPSRTEPSSRRPECRSSRAVHGCACLEIINPCLQLTASYLCVLVTTLEDGPVIEPSRMPFESSCPWLRLSWN
ncbi:uncharacterized protein LOC144152045 isoform X2 [Haemaphysalis longicornis]